MTLHTLRLIFEISAITVAGLITMSVVMATVRAILHGKYPAFNPNTDVAIAEARAGKEGYVHRVLVALDIFLNVVVLAGRQGETISAHSYITSLEGKLWGKLMNKWLCGIQANHGQKAASGDLERSMAETSRLRKILGV
jgi:hypothetical protein